MRLIRLIAAVLLVLGVLVSGVLATDTEMLFFWPGCALLGAAGVLAAVNWRMRVYSAPSDLCLLSVVLLAGYLVSRGLWSPVASYARVEIMMVLGGLVAYLLTSTMLSHPQWRMALLVAVVLLLVGNLIVGSIHFSGKWSFHVVPHFARSYGEGRVGGFFNNANHLAAFLTIALMLLSGVMLFGRAGVTWKLLMGFLCIAGSIGLVLTWSRAGLFGLACGSATLFLLSLWIVWRTNRHLFGMLAGGGLVVLGLGGAVLYQVGAESIKHRMANSPVENDVRRYIWASGLQQHALSPVTGMGARMFTDYGITLRQPGTPVHQNDPIFVHNEYIQMLADYGWVGLGLLALVLILHLVNGVAFLRWFVNWRFGETSEVRSDSLGLAVGCVAALIATLVHAVLEFHFHTGARVVLAAVLCGVLMNPGFNLESHTPLRIPGLRVVAKLALAAAGAALIGGVIRWAPADYAATQADLAAGRQEPEGEMYWLDKALKNDETNAELHYRRGLLRLKQGVDPASPAGRKVLAEAGEDLQRAVEINPWHYLYPVALTDVLDAQQKTSEALVSAMMAIRAAPWHEEARLSLAMHYTRAGEFADAEKAFLWAREAPAKNKDGELTWFDYYKDMLGLAQMLAVKPRS